MSLASYHCSTPGPLTPLLRCRRGRRLSLAAGVAAEQAGRGELAELVAHHVLGHVQLDELVAVVDLEVGPDELRHDGAVARPGAQRSAVASLLGLLHLGQQPLIDVRSLLQRTTHTSFPQNGSWYCRDPLIT